MTESTKPEARSLIILSRGDEELDLAESFLRGQSVASGATILLPDDLFEARRNACSVPAGRYATPDDILRAADEHKPDLVFLFCGYLLTTRGLLSVTSLESLLREFRDRGCRVVTSDPFLGLLSHLTLAQVDTGMLALGQPRWMRWLIQVAVRLRGKVIDTPHLDNVTHLYPTSIPNLDDGVSRVAFCNPANVRAAAPSQSDADGLTKGGSRAARPRWLITLSAMDLRCQEALLGPREFTENLLGMLRYAIEVERDPTLVAPTSIVQRLANALPPAVELLPVCAPAEFQKRLLDAEYLFSWSAFSVSHVVRLANELPVFLFDRGYYSRTIKPFYATARECYTGGWEPTYIDQRQLFSPAVLAHLAKAQKSPMEALRKRCQSSPTPDALVNGLLRAGGPGPA